MLEVAADCRLIAVLVVVVTELCLSDRDVTFSKAFVPVLLPEKFERDADPLQFFVDVLVIRQFIDLICGVNLFRR